MVDICGGNLRRAQRRGALPVPDQAGVMGSGLGALGLARLGDLLGARGAPTDAPRGNFGMDAERKNPLDYLQQIGITTIHRFVSTHPEMDHLDGLDALFRSVPVLNFWHTGVRKADPEFGAGSPYRAEDWAMYRAVQRGALPETRSLQKRAHAIFPFANQNDDGTPGGDFLNVLAPDDALVLQAEQADDMNEASYVLLILTSAGSIVIPGDAHDASWEHVLRMYRPLVQNCALLLAPHHGRDSDRDYEFLDVLRPRLTLMGCAPAEHMGYGSWRRRDLQFITNNQAGSIRVDIDGTRLSVWVENGRYAQARGFDLSVRNPQGFVGVGYY